MRAQTSGPARAAEHGQRVGAGQLLHRRLQRGQQVSPAQVMVDQVGDDLGVGLRLEHVARARSFSRCSSWFSMMPLCTSATPWLMCGCALASVTPPWVAQRVWPMPSWRGSVRPARPLPFRTRPVRRTRLTCPSATRRCRGIVAAVFQALQAFDQHRNHVAIRDRADDAAHGAVPHGEGAILAFRLSAFVRLVTRRPSCLT
jgi:hypothetical protein